MPAYASAWDPLLIYHSYDPQRSKFMGQMSNVQRGPMEMKFNMDDP